MTVKLNTDELRWAIVCAPDDEPTSALARRLHLDYPTTYEFRARVKRQGWICPLKARACLDCGQMMLMSALGGAKRWCQACRPVAERRVQQARSRTKYEAMQAASGPASRRWERWTEEERRYLLEHQNELGTPAGVARVTQHLGRTYAACMAMLYKGGLRDVDAGSNPEPTQ